MFQKTIIFQSIWLAVAFGLAMTVGIFGSRSFVSTDDPPNAIVSPMPQQVSNQEEGNSSSKEPVKSFSATFQPGVTGFVHNQKVMQQSCKACHAVGAEQSLRSSPHLLGFPGELGARQEDIDLPFLGIHASDVSTSLRKHLDLENKVGALVEKVIEESPAYHCGFEKYDVVIAIDDKPVLGEKGLLEAVRSRKPGNKLLIELIRAGKRTSCNVVLGKQRTAQLLHSFRIKGCPTKLNSTTNCRECHMPASEK